MVVVALALLVVAVFAVGLVLFPRVLRELGTLRDATTRELTARNADVDRRLEGVIETMDRRLGELDTKVDRRLETAGKTTTQIHERLGEVSAPTLVVVARHDPAELRARGETVARGVPRARLVEVDSDHYLTLREPARINRLLDDFLCSAAPLEE